ncbi:zinc finger protein 410 isoform 2-T2 [Syngnathus typhle]
MLSDELDSKPELLVQFVQNASIPLVQGLEDPESKHACLPLLTPVGSSLCGHLQLTDGALSPPPESSSSLSELSGVSERSSLAVHQAHVTHSRASPSPPPILHDLQQSDGTSYVLLNLAKSITASSESLIFATDGAVDDEDVSSGDYGLDGIAPWYLRVQELAHDSLIAATRAQLVRDAKASQDARAAIATNGDHTHELPLGGDEVTVPLPAPLPAPPPPRSGRPLASRQILRCSFEGCCRTFTWPAHLKYHLKTHRNDRMFRCVAEGCGEQLRKEVHHGRKSQEPQTRAYRVTFRLFNSVFRSTFSYPKLYIMTRVQFDPHGVGVKWTGNYGMTIILPPGGQGGHITRKGTIKSIAHLIMMHTFLHVNHLFQ